MSSKNFRNSLKEVFHQKKDKAKLLLNKFKRQRNLSTSNTFSAKQLFSKKEKEKGSQDKKTIENSTLLYRSQKNLEEISSYGTNKKLKLDKDKDKEKEIPILLKDYFYREEINSRTQESMEDFTLIKHPFLSLDKHNLSLFCVFDGHGGDFVAKYLKENFASILHNSIKLNYTLNFHSILNSTFESVDKNLEKFDITQNCGSTATIVVMDNNIIYCANVGDSKCFYIDKKNAVQMSEDHNCKNEKEVELLKSKGAIIFRQRVYGSLSLTRSFGDMDFKQYGVTAIPYITKIYADKNNVKYIVIASDGIWDAVNDKDLFKISKKLKGGTSEEFCNNLVNYAVEKGSNDNISCIVIRFG